MLQALSPTKSPGKEVQQERLARFVIPALDTGSVQGVRILHA